MKKLARWLFNTLTVLSLFLCTATAALWLWIHHGGHITVRLAPPNAGALSLRDNQAPARVFLTFVSPFPHPRLSGVRLAPPLPDKSPHGLTPIVIAPFGSIAAREWPRLDVWRQSYQAEVWLGMPQPRFPPAAGSVRVNTFGFPCWLPTTTFAILPACWLAARSLRQRRRPGPGRCAACSYDLTGNQSGVCPECGTKIAEATS